MLFLEYVEQVWEDRRKMGELTSNLCAFTV